MFVCVCKNISKEKSNNDRIFYFDMLVLLYMH